eukprot:gnl/MRDRNA2_/MRDRNA2_18401_c0_seq1.p1 gnl/MRDRNA2_/MRDRNA2_18401_c0~~gnl/MRDRNA2_/MRDRNA2_18401_c0_seq1.p1  ORF type:complete len:678 (+),score=141.41 gnl/MRDRNA2_/MRDRNA2_18401_c0_seq1:103-2136(+)
MSKETYAPLSIFPSAAATSFFGTLPEDDFTDEELSLRQAVLDVLHKIGPAVLITQVSQDPAVKRAKESFLRNGVPLSQWVDRRIGGEVELVCKNGDRASPMFMLKEPVEDDAETPEEVPEDSAVPEARAGEEQAWDSGVPEVSASEEPENLVDVSKVRSSAADIGHEYYSNRGSERNQETSDVDALYEQIVHQSGAGNSHVIPSSQEEKQEIDLLRDIDDFIMSAQQAVQHEQYGYTLPDQPGVTAPLEPVAFESSRETFTGKETQSPRKPSLHHEFQKQDTQWKSYQNDEFITRRNEGNMSSNSSADMSNNSSADIPRGLRDLGWKVAKDGKGKIYYYNRRLNKSVWKLPPSPEDSSNSGEAGRAATAKPDWPSRNSHEHKATPTAPSKNFQGPQAPSKNPQGPKAPQAKLKTKASAPPPPVPKPPPKGDSKGFQQRPQWIEAEKGGMGKGRQRPDRSGTESEKKGTGKGQQSDKKGTSKGQHSDWHVTHVGARGDSKGGGKRPEYPDLNYRGYLPACKNPQLAMEFIKTLPKDRLAFQEINLREKLMKWSAMRWKLRPREPMLVIDALEDRSVSAAAAFLSEKGRSVPLEYWMARRIGGELEVLPFNKEEDISFKIVETLQEPVQSRSTTALQQGRDAKRKASHGEVRTADESLFQMYKTQKRDVQSGSGHGSYW